MAPTQAFSARCPRRASRDGSHSRFEVTAKARAEAISSAADDDSPAPMGTSPARTPCQATRLGETAEREGTDLVAVQGVDLHPLSGRGPQGNPHGAVYYEDQARQLG